MFKFKETISEDGEFIYQMTSECNRIIIGVYPVIFGYRVRSGYVGDMFYHIDYCCGNNQIDVEIIFSAVKSILEVREYDYKLFHFPRQDRKPFMLNTTEYLELLEMANQSSNYEFIKMPNIHSLKTEFINRLF